MKFTLDTTFRFHLRCALYIALAAAAATLVGAFAVSQERLHEMAETQRGLATDTARLQRQLDRQVGEMRDERGEDLAAFEAALRGVNERQSATDELAKTVGSKSPFPIEKVLGSIVELICIDNKDRDTYYTGSGTIIDKSGLIITNQHILVSEDDSLIRFCGIGFTDDLHEPPKIEYVGAAVAVREGTDLALLKITEHLEGKEVPREFQAISLAEAKAASEDLNLGDPIYIGGYPGIGAETFTFTSGVVSGRVGNELIKTSALIDSGTSGGAAFDGSGRYVGVPTAAAAGDIGGSLGYLIGANVIDEFLADYAKGKNLLAPQKR